MYKPLTKHGLQDLLILNYAFAVLQVRNSKEVVQNAVLITDNKQTLYRKRKLVKLIDTKINEILVMKEVIFGRIKQDDFRKLAKVYNFEFVKMIPEKDTNPETLALYMLWINFIDDRNPMCSKVFDGIETIDYMQLIITLTEQIGLTKNIQDDMFILACGIIDKIKGK